MPDIVIEARTAAISKAVTVKRILPFRLRRMVGPFIFMDHAGPITDIPAQPSTLDVLPHPHIGLSTVSYLFGGQVTHRDKKAGARAVSALPRAWCRIVCGLQRDQQSQRR